MTAFKILTFFHSTFKIQHSTFLLLLIALQICGSASAQDEVRVYARGSKHAKRTYALPLKVRCWFKNGKVQDLILTSVDFHDSLHFKQYYNQANYDCRMADVEKIRIRRPMNVIADLIVVGGAGFTAGLTAAAIAAYAGGDKGLFIYTGPPALVGMSGIVYLFYILTANTFRLNHYNVVH